MRRGDPRIIEVDGQQIPATFLGKGHYTNAYRYGDTVYCFVVEDEYMKDCIVEMRSNMPHIPAIKRHDDTRIGPDRKVYSMPYYRNITAKDKDAWSIYKILKKSAERIHREKYSYSSDRDLARWGSYFGHDIINDTQEKVPQSVTNALQELIDGAANYGIGVTFEFGKRNIGADDEGQIVFRDILFDTEKMERELMARRK